VVGLSGDNHEPLGYMEVVNLLTSLIIINFPRKVLYHISYMYANSTIHKKQIVILITHQFM
jgi:hypothetical protein